MEAPTSAGGYSPGQEDGPRALLEAGLLEALRAAGMAVCDGGRVTPYRWRPDPASPRAANAETGDRAGQVTALVRSAPAEDIVVVLGGDCTVGVGTVAGLRQRGDVHRAVADPRGSARAALHPLAGCDALAIHFDVDLVDFLDAPLAENTDRSTAPSSRACGETLSVLIADSRTWALTVTEFNSHHGSPDGETAQRLREVLVDALSCST